ncbi:putative Glutathione S-transferase [Seiridium cardinale]|uniref:Glutathione S-transferase n=1 Tax=Seiridium cardinale TaxID=138064 RepID=A0ABR2XCU5_9PEZI
MSSSDITLYFLGASRAIRVAWLLEELNLPYSLVSANRAPNGLAPPEFKAKIPAPLKKSPTIKDGPIVVQESGAIIDYIIEKYDTGGKLQSSNPQVRAKTREWVHAAEGVFALHGIAIMYARWFLPEESKSALPEMEEKLSTNVRNDLDWIEGHLREQNTKFLSGNTVSAADIMMQFSIEFIYARRLGLNAREAGEEGGDGHWPETKKWLKRCMNEPAFKRAVEKTGYTLESSGQFKT